MFRLTLHIHIHIHMYVYTYTYTYSELHLFFSSSLFLSFFFFFFFEWIEERGDNTSFLTFEFPLNLFILFFCLLILGIFLWPYSQTTCFKIHF